MRIGDYRVAMSRRDPLHEIAEILKGSGLYFDWVVEVGHQGLCAQMSELEELQRRIVVARSTVASYQNVLFSQLVTLLLATMIRRCSSLHLSLQRFVHNLYHVTSPAPDRAFATRARVKSKSDNRLRYTTTIGGISTDRCRWMTRRSARRHTVRAT